MNSGGIPAADALTRAMALALLSDAVRAQADNDLPLANERFDRLLLMIGVACQSPQTIDESHQKLALAAIEAKRGRHAVAVMLKRRAIEARLEMIQQHSRDD